MWNQKNYKTRTKEEGEKLNNNDIISFATILLGIIMLTLLALHCLAQRKLMEMEK